MGDSREMIRVRWSEDAGNFVAEALDHPVLAAFNQTKYGAAMQLAVALSLALSAEEKDSTARNTKLEAELKETHALREEADRATQSLREALEKTPCSCLPYGDTPGGFSPCDRCTALKRKEQGDDEEN